MTSSKKTVQITTDIEAIAASVGYSIETHQMTSGDCWDVRIYALPGEDGAIPYKHPVTGQRMTYNRRRDVRYRDIPLKVARMLVERAVPEVTFEDAERLSFQEALDLLRKP